MSALAEAARVDAAIGEAELTDDEAELVKQAVADGASLDDAIAGALEVRAAAGAGSGGDRQSQPPAESGPSEADLKALEREQSRHEKKLAEIMGEDFAILAPCEVCGGIGFAPAPPPQTHERFKACDTCAGHGIVLTGSRRQGSEVADCPRCGGRGYLERLAPSPQTTAPQPIVQSSWAVGEGTPSGNGPTPPQPQQQPDEWGVPTWMGDPQVRPQG